MSRTSSEGKHCREAWMVRRLVKAWPCLASALLLSAAFPPFNLGLIVFVALAPWLLSLRASSGKEGFRSGYLFGFLLMLGQFFWMFSFVNKWTGSPGVALIPFLLGVGFLGLYFGLVGWQIALCWRSKLPWAIPLVWAGMEVLRSYIPAFAFPYGLLATPLANFPFLIQTAFFGSIFFVGAWVVVANILAVQFLAKEGNWRTLRGYVGVFAICLVGSWMRYETPPSGEKAVVTIGQTGVDLAFGDQNEAAARLAEIVPQFGALAKLQGSELLVLPEGIAGSDGSFPPHPVFQVPEGVPLIFGGQRGDEPRYQTAFAYDGRWSYADKTRLVIFGEYVPLRTELPIIASTFNMPGSDLSPGNQIKTLKVGRYTIGPVLCFETLFPDIAHRMATDGAQLLTVMSVDDWYMGSTAPDQLKMATIWRAVETGRSVARAASLGYSLAVDPNGRVLGELPTGVSKTMRVELPLANEPPFGGFWIFPCVALASLLVLPAYPLVQRLRRKDQ
ncbi:MAG: apolipoprotein N-acyltransferase [Fimbriimonadaceae bacterium]|nr:apolipoprotein N-acyltransferase [Fimbriimonadaceae bacterium]